MALRSMAQAIDVPVGVINARAPTAQQITAAMQNFGAKIYRYGQSTLQ
ncbi:MAG: hypothetical protein IKC05_10150 [Lentisphaeria bacterium]|nr:hypothetical protein [Lentisphaeria bacterium]